MRSSARSVPAGTGNVPRDIENGVTVLGVMNTYAIETWFINE